MVEHRAPESGTLHGGDALSVVVDDHEMVRAAMVAVLASFGCRAEAFHSLAAAETGTEGQAVNLVFLDWRMPGIDGTQAVARAERAWPEARIVLVSGDTASIPLEIQQRVSATLSKPVDPGVLAALLPTRA